MNPNEFDALLLSQVRLGIVSVLMARKTASFSDLKELLDVTQGNLGVHLQKLEDAAYVAVTRSFVERKPRTACRITAKGKRAFRRHVELLRGIAESQGESQ